MKLFALVVMLAMVFAGAAVMMDDSVDAASDEQGYYGILSGTQTLENNVVINQELTVTSNGVLVVKGNLTVAKDVEVTVEKGGVIIVEGKLVTINGNVTVSGSGENKNYDPNTKGISADPESNDNKNNASAIVIKAAGEKITGLNTFKTQGVVINGTVTVEDGASLQGSDSGSELLIKEGGSLTIDGEDTTIGDINVFIAVGGQFNLSGKISGKEGMTVSSYGISDNFTIAMANLKARITDAQKDDDAVSELIFTVTSKNLNGYLKNTEPTATLVKEFILNIDGTVANFDDLTLTGAQYAKKTVDTTVTYEEDKTNTYYTSEDAAKHAAKDGAVSTNYNDIVMGNIIINNLNVDTTAGVTVGDDNDTKVYVTVNGSLTISETTADDYTGATVEGSGVTVPGNVTGDKIVALNAIKPGAIVEVIGTMTANYGSITPISNPAEFGIVVVNGGTITLDDFTDAVVSSIVGAYYIDKDKTAHITDLATAVNAAATAGVKDVYVWAIAESDQDPDGYGGYVITSDLTIPDNLRLNIHDALIVDEGVTLTFSEKAKIDMASAKIFVNGTIADYSGDLEGDYENDMHFQVKIVDDENGLNTYTSLANALANTTSGTIYLYDKVDVTGTVRIPAGVTVMYAENAKAGSAITLDDNGTLVIDGILFLNDTDELVPGEGTVTVNNVIVIDTAVTAGDTYSTIYGVYYSAALMADDTETYQVITSAAVAAENSSEVNGTMTVYGKVAMGTVTFTQGEDNQLTIAIKNGYNGGTDKNVATGDVTIVGGASFDMTAGAYTGSVKSETSAGATAVSFDKSRGAMITFESVETMEGTETDMILGAKSTDAGSEIMGTISVDAGEVTINKAMKFYSATTGTDTAPVINDALVGKLAVAAGATLNIDAAVELSAPGKEASFAKYDTIEDIVEKYTTLDVAGTVNVNNNGAISGGYISVTGTLNIFKGASMGVTIVQNEGTISISDECLTANVERMYQYGTIVGNVETNGYVFVMPGANMAEGTVLWDNTNNETKAFVTEVYINGDLYATAYAAADDTVSFDYIAKYANVSGVNKDTREYYTDAANNDEIENGAQAYVGDYPEVYIVMQPAKATGTVTYGTGMELYIDNVKASSSTTAQLDVGEHTVRFDIKSGYDGANATLTFNGQTIENGATITITEDGFTLVASGAVPMDYTGGSSDNGGMGLTEILLVILVILIVIMAIMVALRLMRS